MRRLIPLFLALSILVACRPTPVPAAAQASFSGLRLEAPAETTAGQPVQITISASSATEEAPLALVAVGSYGPRLYQALLVDGRAEITLPAEDTTMSGLVTLTAVAGEAKAQAEMLIVPSEPVAPVTPLVGARSIIADGEHWAMVVAVPFDRFGNPVTTGTPVTVRALHPGDRLEVDTVTTEHLLAWKQIWSGTQAGRAVISVETLGQGGPEADLLEVPGWPLPFSLETPAQNVPADGRQLVTVRTEALADRFGNTVPDGTLVTFTVNGSAGLERIVPAFVLDGVAEASLQAPERAGELVVRGTVFGVESAPLTIAFSPGLGVEPFQLRVNVAPDSGRVTFTAGPILGPLRQHVPDGTVATFTVGNDTGPLLTLTSETEDGLVSAAARLIALPPGRYRVEARVGDSAVEASFRVPVDE